MSTEVDPRESVALIAREAAVVDAVTTVARDLHLQVAHYETVEGWSRAAISSPQSGAEFEGDAGPNWNSCLVIGLVLDSSEGLDTVRQAVSRRAGLPIVVVSPQPSIESAVAAMRAGAMTVLTWPTSDQKLRDAILESLDLARVVRPQRQRQAIVSQRLGRLTDSELAVLDALMAGRANKEIASAMEIGLRTVELRRSRIMAKMQADNLVELIRMVCDAKQAAAVVPSHGVPVLR